ncbi:hypothetical protein AALO_G00044160 [Alosa alosa]|uniref:Bone morphogenetic protein receptor type-2 n=1 Tax=Alosa alosa TaxID=278164 RepID=A0AAV6H8J0_9TELE|nr:hypothetical protein AALO_G00044160 [Alosa alosa]
MEDCWDQDAEARLTAQCAEERLAELLLIWDRNKPVSPTVNPMSTALQNERNLTNSRRVPKLGHFPDYSSSSYIEDQEGGVLKNLQTDAPSSSGPASSTTVGVAGSVSGAASGEKNRNSINYERQQAQQQQQANAQLQLQGPGQGQGQMPGRVPSPEGSTSGGSLSLSGASSATCSTTLGTTPGSSLMATISEAGLGEEVGGTTTTAAALGMGMGLGVGPTGLPACLQLTQEDLETTKLDPREVDRNLKESSDENLMEHSQKQFSAPDPLGPAGAAGNLLYPLIKLAAEVSAGSGVNAAGGSAGEFGASGGEHPPQGVPAAMFPLPKQQNLPKRPTSLPLGSKHPRDSAASAHRRCLVETGVAKMNTAPLVTVGNEPQMVTAGNSGRGMANGYAGGGGGSSGGNVPTVVGGNTNPAGPQQEVEGQGSTTTPTQLSADGDGHLLACIASSPDEHEPLLRTNNNNNNNSNNNSNVSSMAGTLARALTYTGGFGSTHTDGGASVQMRAQDRSRQPERPNSLELTTSSSEQETSASGDGGVQESKSGSGSGSGERIKRRVKTPYTLKQWRPSTWVVSKETLDAEVNNNSNHSANRSSSDGGGGGQLQQGSAGSKSTTAVFLVGSGAATATLASSDVSGVTCL